MTPEKLPGALRDLQIGFPGCNRKDVVVLSCEHLCAIDFCGELAAVDYMEAAHLDVYQTFTVGKRYNVTHSKGSRPLDEPQLSASAETFSRAVYLMAQEVFKARKLNEESDAKQLELERCSSCDGTGRVWYEEDEGYRDCDCCGGSGELNKDHEEESDEKSGQ